MSNIVQLLFAFVCIGAVLLVGVQTAALPNGVKTCNHETEPDYSSCLTQALQDSWPTIVKGVPEWGIPKLDPFEIDEYEYEFELAMVKSHMVARNVKVVGFADTIVHSVRAKRNADRMSFEVDYTLPKTFAEGYYEIETMAGFFKTSGKGYFNMTMENLRSTEGVDGRIENDRLIIEHFHSSPALTKIDDVKFYFNGMFDGNKDLNNAAMNFINDNWRAIYYNMPPQKYQELTDAPMTDFLNKLIFSKMPFSEAFP